MKIETFTNSAGRLSWRAGDIVEVEKADAEALIQSGQARAYGSQTPPVPAKKKKVPARKVADVDEQADPPRVEED